MSDIFISHSCEDAYLAEKLIVLLVNGLDIKKSDIFCSSIYGTISSGSDFASIIRDELLGCKLSVLIVTKNYLDSQFCLAELGAIWAIDKPVYIFCVSPVSYKDLDKTPFKNRQCSEMMERNAILNFGDKVKKHVICDANCCNSVEFNKAVSAFLSCNNIAFNDKFYCSDMRKQYIEALTSQADYNDEAKYLLGSLYREGVLVPQDMNKAFSLLVNAACDNFTPAIKTISSMFYRGDGIEQNFNDSFKWLNQINRSDHPYLSELGFFYQSGLGCKINKDEAKKCYLLAIEKGDNSSATDLGDIFISEGDYINAIKYYTIAANIGHAYAAFKLGMIYKEGRKGVDSNYSKANHYFLQAADSGFTEAKYQLGQMYYTGCGVFSRNFENAFEWNKKAAEDGHLLAQYYVGYSYLHGLGTDKQLQSSIIWYKKAAEKGHMLSQEDLADIYSLQQIQMYEEAKYWYRKAASQGSATAHRKLGDYYLYLCSNTDQIKAIEHYNAANELNDVIAKLRLSFYKDKT